MNRLETSVDMQIKLWNIGSQWSNIALHYHSVFRALINFDEQQAKYLLHS